MIWYPFDWDVNFWMEILPSIELWYCWQHLKGILKGFCCSSHQCFVHHGELDDCCCKRWIYFSSLVSSERILSSSLQMAPEYRYQSFRHWVVKYCHPYSTSEMKELFNCCSHIFYFFLSSIRSSSTTSIDREISFRLWKTFQPSCSSLRPCTFCSSCWAVYYSSWTRCPLSLRAYSNPNSIGVERVGWRTWRIRQLVHDYV